MSEARIAQKDVVIVLGLSTGTGATGKAQQLPETLSWENTRNSHLEKTLWSYTSIN